MGKLNVAQFASELGLPVALLLEQLNAAGIAKNQESDPMSENDKAKLLEHLRRTYGPENPAGKITLIRRETKKADNSSRAHTIQLEVRKRRALAQTTVAGADAHLKELEANKEVVTPVKHKRQSKVDQYFSKVLKLLPEHPNESLNNIRKAVEAICKDILDETYEKKDQEKGLKPASAFTSLEDMTQELKRRKQLPVAIEKHFVVLQRYGNFGSHDQEPDQEDTLSEKSASTMANTSLLPLKAVVDWYRTFDLSAQ